MTARLQAADLEQLLEFGTATVYEASGIDCDLDPAIRAVWTAARVCGPALPVRTGPEDNLALHLALEAAVDGDVLVVDAGGGACGFWGEVLTVAAQMRGVAGLVIDGGVRDVRELAELRFPVFSRCVAVRRTAKEQRGMIGDPVIVASRPVRRGDIVIADGDGVLVLPVERLDRVLHDAAKRVEKERSFLAQIREGATTVDLYGLRR